MDLPPLSFHASLEEQWDEEEEPEEIETMLKVVSPDYHQSLDVFSKVKAEKLPAHHACDDHSKLEGLLPPIENVEKGFIRSSSSSTEAPVLFVEEKDGGLCLCVDYHKLNSVTRRNRYPVPPMNQLLTVFDVSTIFSNIDLGDAYNLLRIKEGEEKLTTFRNNHKLIPADLNYEIHDKELLGILWDLTHWRAFLLSLSTPFEVLKDHSSLQYFMSSKVLTHCQARWAEFLSDFHFTITSCPGRLDTLPDALSHRDKVYPDGRVEFISKNPHNFHQIKKEVWKDNDYEELVKKLEKSESVPNYSIEHQAKLLLFKDRVSIPSNGEIQLNILQKSHDSPVAGHPGQEKTLKLIKREVYWSCMNQFIKVYLSSCQKCSRNKNIHSKKFGLLKTLSIPSGPWNSLSMDFITQWPLSTNLDPILVVVDRFPKNAIFIPPDGTITALDLAQNFISHISSKHGLPVSIVSHRGSLWVSSFWTQLCQQLKRSRDLSTGFHPETDGQTERVNQILEQYLWMYVSYHQDDWHTWLPLAEFAYNKSKHLST
ncbi:hypothetical protein O181_064176 [Austropuccinia psidii MF-1]|uniref:Integrase catalytic domain-containing protein n=1 Tax=Austropuccinia psidii MF-1 TaxID=1389203 RepID=A0A9Q3ELF3_9BASI|nr:hypothetical protein [Austropuccinia psidii MF-1]